MSASDATSKINLTDNLDTVAEKLQDAYCPQGEVTGHGVLEYLQYLVFPILNGRGVPFEIERPEQYGGDLTYETYDNLEADFVAEDLHPQDLKTAAAEYISETIDPIRRRFEDRPELVAQASPEKYD